MTAAGFYHVPDPVEKDTARCFYCCRTICGFEEGDDPVEEHLRRTKDCKYAKYGNIKDLQSSLTLFEYSQYEAERKDNYIRYQTQEDIKYQISQKEYLYEDLKENIENIKVWNDDNVAQLSYSYCPLNWSKLGQCNWQLMTVVAHNQLLVCFL